jgi:hypothetical protein
MFLLCRLSEHEAWQTAEWVNYNTPLLQEYAERQISPPLIERVSIEVSTSQIYLRLVVETAACLVAQSSNTIRKRDIPNAIESH